MLMVEIWNKIKELRESKNMTQKELAEFLNVTPQAISKWERNKSYPDLDTLVKLSKYFNISTDTILGNTKQSFFSSLFSKKEGRKSMENDNKGKNEATSEKIENPQKILLFGITGMMTDYEMYTGLLVTKMNNLARDNNINVTVQAYSVSKIAEKGRDADCILLCPELHYAEEEIKHKFPEIPVKIIAKKDYAMLDGMKILKNVWV